MADADEPDVPAPKKPDLRFTSRVDQGVSIDRDLSGKGHLARGSFTRMSEIKFNIQAKSRDYIDPELQALHVDGASMKPKHLRTPDIPKGEGPVPEPVAAPSAVVSEVVPQSFLGRFTGSVRRWFTGH